MAKPADSLENIVALGLRLQQNKAGKLMFRQGKEILKVKGDLTKHVLLLGSF